MSIGQGKHLPYFYLLGRSNGLRQRKQRVDLYAVSSISPEDMTTDIFLVLAIAAAAMGLFITEKLRIDVVAILVLVSLTVLDLIKPAEALSGFSNSATITVGAMFVLAAGLQNSGALAGLNTLLERTRSPFFLLV